MLTFLFSLLILKAISLVEKVQNFTIMLRKTQTYFFRQNRVLTTSNGNLDLKFLFKCFMKNLASHLHHFLTLTLNSRYSTWHAKALQKIFSSQNKENLLSCDSQTISRFHRKNYKYSLSVLTKGGCTRLKANQKVEATP